MGYSKLSGSGGNLYAEQQLGQYGHNLCALCYSDARARGIMFLSFFLLSKLCALLELPTSSPADTTVAVLEWIKPARQRSQGKRWGGVQEAWGKTEQLSAAVHPSRHWWMIAPLQIVWGGPGRKAHPLLISVIIKPNSSATPAPGCHLPCFF